MRTKKLLLAGTAAVMAAAGVPAVASADAEPVKIGFVGGLTGYLAFFDGMVRNGAQIAVDEINEAGGVAGGHQIEFVVQDGRSEPAASAVGAQDLVSEGVHAMLTPCDVDPAIAVGQIASGAEIPMLSPCASTPTLPAQVGEFMFNLKTADNLQAAVLGEYAHEQDYETAYVLLSPDTPYTDMLPRYFIEVFEKLGGEVLHVETYGWDQQDFSTEVTGIREMDPQPDVIMTSAYEPHFPAFISQLRGAGVDIPVLNSDGIDSPTTIEVGEPAHGVVLTMAGFPAEGSELEEFYRKYEDRYGDYEPFAFSAMGYEAVYIIADAIERAGELDGRAIRDAIDETEDFPGVSGTTITYKDQDRVALRDVSLVRVGDGAFEFIRQVSTDPEMVPDP